MKELFTYLCNFSIVTSVAILLAVLLRPVLKKGPSFIRCILWALVFLRLLVPVGLAEFSVPAPTPFETAEESVSLPQAETVVADNNALREPVQSPAGNTAPEHNSPASAPVADRDVQQPEEVPQAAEVDVLRILSAVWAVGVVGMLGYLLVSNLLLRYRVRGAIVYDSRIRVIDRDCSPFVFGMFRPIIYIPASASKGDWPYIIAHESSHIKRLDHVLKPVAFFVLCFYWFNPLVWAAYLLLGKDIEYACDEKTVKSMESGERKAYSLALLAVSRGESIALAPSLSFGKVSAKERVKRVMNRRIPVWAICLAVLICASLVFLTVFSIATADSADTESGDTSSPETESGGSEPPAGLEDSEGSASAEGSGEPDEPDGSGGIADGFVTVYNDDGSIRCVEDYAGGWLVKRTNYLDGKVDLITEYDHWIVVRETTFGNNGEVIVWDHDKAGALRTKTVYNADGDVDSVGEYENGFLIKETTYAFGHALYYTAYEYGPHGHPTLTSYYDKEGNLSSYLVNEYDGEGRMLRESLYEAGGTLHRDLIVEEFDANGNQSRWSNYIYDGEGNPTYENHFYYENGELKVDEVVHGE